MNDLAGSFSVDTASVDTALAANFRLLLDVDVKLTVEIGSATLTLRELLALGEASVIVLDRDAGAPLDIFANGTRIGRGEIVMLDGKCGLKMTELATPDKRIPCK